MVTVKHERCGAWGDHYYIPLSFLFPGDGISTMALDNVHTLSWHTVYRIGLGQLSTILEQVLRDRGPRFARFQPQVHVGARQVVHMKL